METIGIIGFGSFGSLLARMLAPSVKVLVYDSQHTPANLPNNVTAATFAEVATCPAIIIATDLWGIAPTCERLAAYVRPQTVVLDVCSVKMLPAHIFAETLGSACQLLVTHPLFGPNSVAQNGDSGKGLTMVWHELGGASFPALEELFAGQLGVVLKRMTPEEHDRQMAWVHALTFFVGRGLVTMGLPELALDTGYYQKLRDLYELEQTHSRALFDTIEAGNPYAAEIRRRFITTLQQLDGEVRALAPWPPRRDAN